VEVDADAPNYAIYARTTPRSVRALDPAIGDPRDEAAIASALAERDDLLVPRSSQPA